MPKIQVFKEFAVKVDSGIFIGKRQEMIWPFVKTKELGGKLAQDNTMRTWTIAQLRNAGRYAGQETVQQTEANLPVEIRDGLGDWMANKRDEDIYTALHTSCTKIYYVNSRAGTGTVTATDLLTLADVVKAQTYASSTADPRIPPIKISQVDQKTVYRYLFLMHSHVAYDLKVNDATYQQATREAGRRGNENPLFSGALIDWEGTILCNEWRM